MIRHERRSIRQHAVCTCLSALVAPGWYSGDFGIPRRKGIYGQHIGLLAQLEVDGSVVAATGPSWLASSTPYRLAEIYDGETYDARATPEPAGVSVLEDLDLATLAAPVVAPVRRTEMLAPVARELVDGVLQLDFGQNLVGWMRVTLRDAPPGAEVVMRHAEILGPAGRLFTEPLRSAKATDTYVASGADVETYEPRFTFHGFRYVEVTGWPGDLDAAVAAGDVVARVYHTDLERTGWFECSDPLVNRLHENVVWSMRGNVVDIPTDCPQRDERLGWTGDIQVFAPSASFLFDTTGFLASWLRDLAIEQADDGTVPLVVPDILTGGDGQPTPMAAWSDAAVIVPWVLAHRSGDLALLAAQWPSMAAWVERVLAERDADGLWTSGLQLGDWLDPAAPPDQPGEARADRHLVASAYLVRSLTLLADAARLLGRDEDHRRYAELAEVTRQAFVRVYTTPAGRLVSDAPTAYALAIAFDLLQDDEQRRRAGARLADLVRASGFRISTGFVGTPVITDALTATGHLDVAYRLLLQRLCPSWLYPVSMGATTIWERWDSMLPDGTINPGQMTSFNHYALGAVADWLHRTVAGLAPAAPGYRRIEVRPRPGGGLTSAAVEHDSPYGSIRVAWQRVGEHLELEVDVPAGVSATVVLPGDDPPFELGPGTHRHRLAWPE
jgi:alpha-L-rhamnosidase